MSAKGSSQMSQGNLDTAPDHVSAQFDDIDDENPFKLPSDELIFTYKESEKDRRIIEREKNKQLRVWEKNRPTREGCLRKICETDIEPTQLAINPKVQSKVNVAEAAGFTIPIERPKNRENRWKLIEKKREMFLVQQMLETKQEEIERLAEHATMREDGLTCSENMLETDTKAFLVFFNELKEKTQDAQKLLDKTRRQKNEKSNELRQIAEEIQILVSNISKNVESLEVYNNFKVFLDSLPSALTSKEREEIERVQKLKKERLAKKRQEQELVRQTLGGGSRGGKPGRGMGFQQKTKGISKQSVAEQLDLELNIPNELKDIIEDPDDDLPLNLTEPGDLMQIFATLEENNLLEMGRMQETEDDLEVLKQEKKMKERQFASEIAELEIRDQLERQRIKESITERDALLSFTEDGEGQNIDDHTLGQILQWTNKLYYLASQGTEMTKQDSMLKSDSMTPVTMLTEVENVINAFFVEFDQFEKDDAHTYNDEQKQLKKHNRIKAAEETLARQKQMNDEKAKQRQLEKDKSKFAKIGKIAMMRSNKPPVKREEVKQKKRTEQEEDFINYGLENFLELAKSEPKAQLA